MQPSLVLGTEATAATHCLHLLPAIPVKLNFRPESAAITGSTFQFKVDPIVVRRDSILVDKQRSALVSNNHIEHAAIPKVSQRYRAPVVSIVCANRLCDVIEFTRTVVYPDTLLLISR